MSGSSNPRKRENHQTGGRWRAYKKTCSVTQGWGQMPFWHSLLPLLPWNPGAEAAQKVEGSALPGNFLIREILAKQSSASFLNLLVFLGLKAAAVWEKKDLAALLGWATSLNGNLPGWAEQRLLLVLDGCTLDDVLTHLYGHACPNIRNNCREP